MEALRIKEIVAAVNGKLIVGREEDVVTSVFTNSREVVEGALFVPIIGERVDAHDFIEGAFTLGATATFTSKPINEISLVGGKTYILVEDTLKAMQDLAMYYRNKFSIPVIGVTGSVGKTTTKEMIAAALENTYNVLKTSGNMNSQVGLPLTIFNIEKHHEVAVIEMGMSEEGELAKLARIARPTFSVVTNIGVSHIAQLGSRENIRREKLSIINENKEGNLGYLFINGNDGLLRELIPYQSGLLQPEQVNSYVELNKETNQALFSTYLYSYGTEKECTYQAKDMVFMNGETFFTYVNEKQEETRVMLQVLGEHNVMNAVVALAIAERLHVKPKDAKLGLVAYQPIAMRGQITKIDGRIIIDDTYNASPDSMKSGLNVLLALEGIKRRIAVLADVLELGAASKDCHYQVGEYVVELLKEKKKIDEVVVIGSEAKYIAEAIEDNTTEINTYKCMSNQEAITYLNARLQDGDAVLVKGSRGMHTDEIVKVLIQPVQ